MRGLSSPDKISESSGTNKLLHVIAGMDPKLGGVCQGVRSIIKGLSALGVDNEVVSLDFQDAPFLVDDNFPIHALGSGKSPWQYNKKLIPWLVDNFPRFDSVIIHGLWLYPGYAVQKAIEVYKKKRAKHYQRSGIEIAVPCFYVMPHGMLDPYFQRTRQRRLKAIRNFFYWKLIESKVVNNATGLLFTCEAERKLANQPFHPYLPNKEMVVGLGVDEPPAYISEMKEAFQKKLPEIKDDAYFIFLGRIDEKKGVDLLINAYAKLIKTHKNNLTLKASSYKFEGSDFPKLVIAGPGIETEYGKKLTKLVAEDSELKNKIYFPGMLSGDAKWGAFYGCESFVLASHQENFGIAVVEALACGRPVLISNQVNICVEVEESGGGFVAPDTMEETYRMLERWVKLSGEEKVKTGKLARAGYEKFFALVPAANRLFAVLNTRVVT